MIFEQSKSPTLRQILQHGHVGLELVSSMLALHVALHLQRVGVRDVVRGTSTSG